MLLDWMLGQELGTIHNSTELIKMLQLHVEHNAIDEDQGPSLPLPTACHVSFMCPIDRLVKSPFKCKVDACHATQGGIMKGAITFKEKVRPAFHIHHYFFLIFQNVLMLGHAICFGRR
jgi:hypothetical protein